ncbi:MAG: sugar nucleotide-binding protein [Caulobacteraceae bacterium]
MSGPILATGGRGRLATALAARGGEQVVALPRTALDIGDAEAVAAALADLRPSAVINAAAVSSVDAADAARAHAVNAVAPGVLAAACAAAGVPLIHLSTDYVFGAATDRPWREDDPVSPINAYGRMKAEGETRALAAGGRVCVARVAWLFGDGQDFIARMLAVGRARGEVKVAADQIGSPTPIGVLAERLLALAVRMAGGDATPDILHLAGSPPVSRADWVAAGFAAAAARGEAVPRLVRARLADFPEDAPRPAYSALDTARASALFGSPIDWRDGLA